MLSKTNMRDLLLKSLPFVGNILSSCAWSRLMVWGRPGLWRARKPFLVARGSPWQISENGPCEHFFFVGCKTPYARCWLSFRSQPLLLFCWYLNDQYIEGCVETPPVRSVLACFSVHVMVFEATLSGALRFKIALSSGWIEPFILLSGHLYPQWSFVSESLSADHIIPWQAFTASSFPPFVSTSVCP